MLLTTEATLLATTMEEIIRGLHEYGGTSTYWLLGFSFIFHKISLWKYMALIEWINTMIGKIDSISKGIRNLPERVQAVEFEVITCFDKVTERIYLQDGNLQDIQEQLKDEMLSLKGNINTLEILVQNGEQKIHTVAKSLTIFEGHEIQAL